MNSAVDSAWTRPAWSEPHGGAETVPPAAEHVFAEDALLHRDVVAQAARTPEAVAVVAEGRSLTYAELDAESVRVARCLADGGAGPEHLVAVTMEKGWEQVVACLGVLRAGAAYVPVDPRWPARRVRGIVEAAGIRQALVQPWLRDAVEWPEGVLVREVGPPAADDPAVAPPEVTSSPRDLAYVIYTSGSTGTPKGVMIEHGPALNTVLDVNEELGLTSRDRVLALSALNFDLSVYDLFGPLSVGGAVVIPAPGELREPGAWLRRMRQDGVTVWNSVPALMAMLCAYVPTDAPRPALPPLRAVLMSGDWIPVALPADIWRLFPEAAQWSLGGATEASIWSVWHRIAASDGALPSIPYGVSMRDQRVFVADRAMRPRPPWVPGEIHIAGAGLARGYLGDAERTARSFVTDPATGRRLYRTGDWGRLLPNGEIEFLGREDMQVKVGGHRIELGDVEAALLGCPGVRDAVAVVHGDRGKKRLTAHVLLRPDVAYTGAELREMLTDRVPEYMVPAAVAVRDAFPLTSNGKVDRAALAAVPDDPAAEEETAAPPADAEEKLLLDIWGAFFDAPALSVTDDFFELGGDSLLAVRLVSALRRELGADLPVAALFAAPTIRALARRIRDEGVGTPSNDRPTVVPIRTEGTATPLVLAHPVGGEVLCYAELSRRLGEDQPVYALQSPHPNERESTLTELVADYARAVARDVPGSTYRLAGWSMGGLLSLELARELESLGHVVERVDAIDVTETPGDLERAEVSDARLRTWLARDLAGLTGHGADTDTEYPSLEDLFSALGERGILPSDIDLTEFESTFARFAANARALAGYRPEPYPGAVHFIQAESGGGAATAEAWLPVCEGGVTVAEVPGDHYTVLTPECVDAVVDELRAPSPRAVGSIGA
ncbi:amino acid adenylation domain-containing protein [Nocardiopsis sp. NPDC049922]|uniref:amino acid adenylation domain-containing protein n=1 Tax=Nocardiopsis sp. NPDC049922 TaxID=3155157 RepID=UPI00340BE701